MRNLFVFLVALLALPASAQEVEVRGGVAVGSQSETYAALEMQPRFSGDVFVSYGVWRSVSAFGGFSFNSFGCKDALCLGGVTVTNLHGIAGAEYRRWLFWGRVGGMYGQVKMKGTASTGAGMYMGAGVQLGLPFSIGVRPGLSYRWMMMGNGEYALSLTGDVGVSIHF